MSRSGLRLKTVLVMILALLAGALACNAPGFKGVPTPPSSYGSPTFFIDPTLLTPPPVTDALTQEAEATEVTPTVEATATSCGYWSEFVDDVTIPDGTEIQPGEDFEKTWQVRSNGCQDWPPGTRLVFWSGDQMGGPDTLDIQPPGLNLTTDISVQLTAPTEPGDYRGEWLLIAPDGAGIGSYVWVEITVPALGTPTVTVTPSTGTPQATGTPNWAPFVGTWINQDQASGRIVRVAVRIEAQTIFVHVWSKDALGGEVDWGETTVPASDANDNILTVAWTGTEPGGAATRNETQNLAILHDGRLQINGQVDYSDPGKTDYYYSEYFDPSN